VIVAAVVPPLPPAQPTALPSGALSGVRVVELGGIGPAQLGGLLLSDLGADVVLVDRRGTGPAALTVGDPRAEVLNRGRRSIALDLKTPEGVATAWRLIETADVLVDPYRPGVAERLGLGPEEALARNPRLVYARMTGWGQDGPLAQAAGHDINYIALAGALEPMGEEGRPPPVPLNLIGDFGGGGMLMAFGIVAALLERERSGQGQVLDVAMVDGVAALLNGIFHLRAIGGWREGRGRNWVQGAAPWYRAYATADGGHVTVGALEPKFYALLLERLGLDPAAWPQWDEADWDALAIRLEELFAGEDLAHWQALLEGTDACFAPAVPLAAVAEHPHHVARGTYVRPDGVLQAAPVPRFSRTPGAIRRPPPLPGEHAEELLAELDARERRG
jgi:alpha-methylacyl-CoA racemase